MRLSDKRKSALYSALSDPIMELRVDANREGMTREQLDRRLFTLEQHIWRRIKRALDMEPDA